MTRDNKMRIAVILGNRLRDLWAYTYLKFELEKLGNEVRILNPGDFIEFNKFLPHVVIVPEMITQIMWDIGYAAKKKKMLVINMKAEGITNEYFEKCMTGYGTPATDLTDILIVWGNVTKQHHLKYTKEDPSDIFICGNIRFDKYYTRLLTKEEFCRKYDIPVEKPIVTYGNNLIWTSDNLRDSDINKNSPELQDTSIEEFTQLLKRMVKLRGTIIDSLFRITKKFNDVTFVIKPHPHESTEAIESYYEGMKKYGTDNLYVIKEIDISDILNVTDIYLFWNSVSATEAWFLNKPTIGLHFGEEINYYLCDFIKGCDVCTTEEKFEKRLKYYLNGGEIPEELLRNRNEFIKANCYKVDGKRTQEVAKVIDEYVKKNAVTPVGELYYREIIYISMYLLKRLLGMSINDRLQFWKTPTNDLATPEHIKEMELRVEGDIYNFKNIQE